jgi:hypothetical protein
MRKEGNNWIPDRFPVDGWKAVGTKNPWGLDGMSVAAYDQDTNPQTVICPDYDADSIKDNCAKCSTVDCPFKIKIKPLKS